MSSLGRIRIGTTARALAAALAIGGALVSLTAGPTAYAARGRSIDDDGAGTGDAPGRTTATAKEKNINDYPKCTITRPDGTIDFFLPLETVTIDGKEYLCTADGTWIVLGPPRPTSGVKVTGGGIYTSTP